jgi:HNH endonuclease/HIT domain-containing protein
VLAESGRRCALCGATEEERPLDVDHILPRSRGGKTEKANPQVLCSRCNRAKGNRDTRDFRRSTPELEPDCPFCGPELGDHAIEQTSRMLAIGDQFAVTDGHTLIVPRRHVESGLDLTEAERQDAHALIRLLSLGCSRAIRSRASTSERTWARPPARLSPTPIFISSLDDQAIVQIRPVELEAYSQAGLATHDLKETC